jgi:uncharacterized protein DUF6463
MIKWAGRIIVLVGAGHLLVALALYGRPHFGAWFSGALWGEDLAAMSDAGAALWLTVDSFGLPLILVGLTVLWLDRRGLTPPSFLAWTVGVWAVVEAVIFGPSPSWLLPVAAALLLVGARRAGRRETAESRPDVGASADAAGAA